VYTGKGGGGVLIDIPTDNVNCADDLTATKENADAKIKFRMMLFMIFIFVLIILFYKRCLFIG
jgi:predicted nucleic acid-binding Zn ribbon protein